MLSLINIRVKYLVRNPCLLFWSYLFIPSLILFIAIIVILNGKDRLEFEQKMPPISVAKKEFKGDYHEDENNILKGYWDNTLLAVDNGIDCTKVKRALFNLALSDIECTQNRKEMQQIKMLIL